MVLGLCSHWGTTPSRLRRRHSWSLRSSAGNNVQCPLCIILANSWRRNFMCSFADLWGPRLRAARIRPRGHGADFNSTGAPWSLKRQRCQAARCGMLCTSSAKSPRLSWLLSMYSFQDLAAANRFACSMSSSNSSLSYGWLCMCWCCCWSSRLVVVVSRPCARLHGGSGSCWLLVPVLVKRSVAV